MDKKWIKFNGSTDGLIEGNHYRIRTKSKEEHRIKFDKNGKMMLDSHKVKVNNSYETEFYIPLEEIDYIQID